MATFKKRSGTTDFGSEYEKLMIANLVINLVTDNNTNNFFLSANDESFGNFDDIVVQTESHQGTKNTFAVQLVHTMKRVLTLEHLRTSKGNFSLKKYFYSFGNTENLADKFILYTNSAFKGKNNTKFQLEGEEFYVTLSKVSPGVSILDDSKECFKFSVVDEGDTISGNILQYKMFFEKFYLFTNQKNFEELTKAARNKFQKLFCANETEYNNYLKIITEWCFQQGKKQKLTKMWAQRAIALQILSSRIHPLSFNVKVEDIREKERKIIMREAISAFDITIFDKQSYDKLKILWSDCKNLITDNNETKRLIKDYLIFSNRSTDDLSSRELSKLLWLMGKCPLIVTLDETVYQALQLCSSEKFVVLKEHVTADDLQSKSIFRNLLDLKTVVSSVFEYFMAKFTFSLQGRTEISLEMLHKKDERFIRLIKTDDLLKMMDGSLCIGDDQELLPEPYIARCLSQDIIDIEYLNHVTDDTIVIIDEVMDKEQIKNKLKRQDINYVDIREGKGCITSTKNSIIYLSDIRVSFDDFQEIHSKHQTKNCHQFRITDNSNLNWIRSTGDIDNFEKFRLSQRQFEEKMLWSSKPQNNMTIIIGDLGSGKTVLIKSLKNNYPSKFWIVILTPEEVYLFLKSIMDKKNIDVKNAFHQFLLNTKYTMLEEKDKEFLQLFLEQNNIICVWDAIDEVSNEYLEKVLNLIVELCQYSRAQWITSRSHLKELLEKKFGVLSVTLMLFNEKDQQLYIRRRLEVITSKERIEEVIASTHSSSIYKDILGLPLLIHMFTEVLRQNAEKYFSQLSRFNINTLYRHFVEEKINLYFSDKMNVHSRSFLFEEMILKVKQTILDLFEKIALKAIFPEENFENIDDDLKKNLELGLSVGIIVNIQEQVPKFCHDSFAAYFAALYFSKRLELVKMIKNKFFLPKYNNMRVFFDNILAEGSLPHLAVISRNFEILSNWEGEISTCKDKGGRTALHLACSCGQRHPALKIKEDSRRFTVNDSITVKPESEEYIKIVDYLLNRCDFYERDNLFKMTPLDYAHKSECLKEELMIIMKLDKTFSELYRDVDYVVSVLYYSAALGYLEPFNLRKLGGYSKKNIFDVKDKSSKSLSLIASQSKHNEIVKFFEKNEAVINRLGDYKKNKLSSLLWRVFFN